MHPILQKKLLQATEAEGLTNGAEIQELWSGYGRIVRIKLQNGRVADAVLKHVVYPEQAQHPRGWNTPLSHQRKVRSYAVEMAFYNRWSARCTDTCRVPVCYITTSEGEEHLLALEDLDSAGFAVRKEEPNRKEQFQVLRWLAHFHAVFLNEKPEDLWPVGTYWHLATRPDEWKAMQDQQLKAKAAAIDEKLNNCRFQTFVHGDAKAANFCFADNGEAVAAVDFQYVGGGCGMKDVAYFLSSCLGGADCEALETELLTFYFNELRTALQLHNKAQFADAVVEEWSALYPVAWTDFYRFLNGWLPTHWKVNTYVKRLSSKVLQSL